MPKIPTIERYDDQAEVWLNDKLIGVYGLDDHGKVEWTAGTEISDFTGGTVGTEAGAVAEIWQHYLNNE